MLHVSPIYVPSYINMIPKYLYYLNDVVNIYKYIYCILYIFYNYTLLYIG